MTRDGIYEVNWQNPMLLGDAHLRLADRCHEQSRQWLARAVVPAAGGYGLFPLNRGGGASLEITHEHGADRFSIQIQRLSALAPDGTALAFDEEAFAELEGRLSAQVELERNPPRPVRLGILVERMGVDDEGRTGEVELGEPMQDEEPPRRPLKTTLLRARIEVDSVSRGGCLKVAEYLWDGITVEAATDYLPPALTVAATTELTRCAVALRKELRGLREILLSAATQEPSEDSASLLAPAVLPWLAAAAAVEDGIPETSPEIHPYYMWNTVMRDLRVARTMLGATPAAMEHAIKNFVQEGKLSSGDTHFFEELDRFLGEPYDHDYLGSSARRGRELLSGLSEVVTELSGATLAAPEPVIESDVYFYREKKYNLAAYGARVLQIDEAWHTCFLRELQIEAPRSLLLVCDRSLMVQNPRPTAGLWMLDKYERVIANMFRVTVDNEADSSKVVALFQEIGEPAVTDVSIASRGLFDLSGLSAEPDELLRIYYEV